MDLLRCGRDGAERLRKGGCAELVEVVGELSSGIWVRAGELPDSLGELVPVIEQGERVEVVHAETVEQSGERPEFCVTGPNCTREVTRGLKPLACTGEVVGDPEDPVDQAGCACAVLATKALPHVRPASARP